MQSLLPPRTEPNRAGDRSKIDTDLEAALQPATVWLRYWITKVTRWLLTGAGLWLVTQEVLARLFH